MTQAPAALPCTVKRENVRRGVVFTAPRWKGDRKVIGVGRVRREGKVILRIDYIDLRTSRTGWAEVDAFIKNASLKSEA